MSDRPPLSNDLEGDLFGKIASNIFAQAKGMTRFIHDQFSKDYLEELLKPFGTVQAPSRVAAEVKEIDVLFTPLPTQTAKLNTLITSINQRNGLVKLCTLFKKVQQQ